MYAILYVRKGRIQMALKGKLNGRFSIDSKELIEEIKNDIAEFGKEEIYAVWLRKYSQYNVEFIVNYDFIIDDENDPFRDFETKDDSLYGKFEKGENERIVLMSADKILDYLQKQNDPIEIYEINV